jgi:hypothetical protein
MCVGSRAVAGGSLQECLSVRHLGLDHDQTRSGTQLIALPRPPISPARWPDKGADWRDWHTQHDKRIVRRALRATQNS